MLAAVFDKAGCTTDDEEYACVVDAALDDRKFKKWLELLLLLLLLLLMVG
jgi:hypothetical protein